MSAELFTQLLLGACASLLSVVGIWVGKNIQDTRVSIEALNVHMAVVLEKISNHDMRITKLETKKRTM